jgi:predicted ATPase/DNA-binding winged helix-turn-helix (wHTH) protein
MIQLGVIELEPSRRRLKVRGNTVPLSARAFDVLETLLLAGGAVVSKEELFRRVWPGLVVEENNLQVQVSAIRKALGDDREWVQTVSKRGYRLVVEHVVCATGMQLHAATAGSTVAHTNLPFPVSEIIGRERSIEELDTLLSVQRIVTLTGPGGIGKTRLSLEAGRRALPLFADGVWLAELGSLATPLLVAGAVGSALGVRIVNHAARHKEIAEAIGDRHLLLVLDNCEHLLEEVAQLVECIARMTPHAHVLATSREPLGVYGETAYRVPSLDVSNASASHEGAEPSAVVLFRARMRALSSDVTDHQRDRALIRALCERLDGIPLAIEIAAAWAPTLGLEQLSARLDDRFRLLMAGGRTALPRHRTLKATLDWSFDLLADAERAMFCSFAIFAGGFTLDAALALCPPGMAPLLAIGVVTGLVRKSLIVVDIDAAGARYRLLETTRAYALEKLHERGAWDRVSARHASFFSELLRWAQVDPGAEHREAQLRLYRHELDNVRAAIDWALVGGRDLELGVSLAARVTPLMFDFSLLEEAATLADQALRALKPGDERPAEEELTLLGMKAAAVAYTQGPTEEVAATWKRVQDIATRLGDSVALWRATWGVWNQKIYAGEPEASLPFAHQGACIETPYPEAIGLLQHRMLGTTFHFLGNQRDARRHLEQIVTQYDHHVHHIPMLGSRLDHGRAARVTLTRVLWLLGELDHATELNRRNVTESGRAAPPLLRSYALVDAAIPVSLMLRQWEEAERYCDELQRGLAIHRVPILEACAACFADMVKIRSGPAPERLARLKANIERLRRTHFLVHLTLILCVMAEELGAAGQAAQGLETVGEALRTCERTGERWCVPELLRVRGELTLIGGAECALELAGRDFIAAIELANSQGALFWELRAAVSLARSEQGTERADAARRRLKAIYDRFSEGFDTADLVAARALIERVT